LLYIAHGFAIEQLAETLTQWLTPAERTQAQSYTSQARQVQYQVGRGLLRWLACRVNDVAPDEVVISRQSNGAPCLTIANVEVACSISHKTDAVMVAFGDVEALGVDIELMQPRKRQAELVNEFSDGFMQHVKVEDLKTFYQRWTLAEAVTKAQQGKLLATLREAFGSYAESGLFHTEQQHMLCCYSVSPTAAQWWRVTTTATQTLASELVLETN
tara:strand:+ start:1151 stop:1795 length:645 start_codon:yes stop_codon:yes gene_type:complete